MIKIAPHHHIRASKNQACFLQATIAVIFAPQTPYFPLFLTQISAEVVV
jgi:hypothetical protein